MWIHTYDIIPLTPEPWSPTGIYYTCTAASAIIAVLPGINSVQYHRRRKTQRRGKLKLIALRVNLACMMSAATTNQCKNVARRCAIQQHQAPGKYLLE